VSDTYALNDKTFLTAAARFNQTTIANQLTAYSYLNRVVDSVNSTNESFTYRKLNPSLGLTHQAGNQWTWFGNWAQSNRAPTILELGCADSANPCTLPSGLQSDPYLSQVVSQTLEGGMRWKNDRGYNLSVSAYQTINTNDIVFLAANTTRGYFNNFAKTQYLGLDVNASKNWGTWRLNATYSYLKATYEATDELLGAEREVSITPGTRMPGLPLHKLKIHVVWQATDQWVVGSSLIVSSSIVTQGNEDGYIGATEKGNAEVKGYTLLNLNTTYTVQKGFEVFGKILNVFDTRYETYGMLAADSLNTSGGEQTLSKFVAPGAPRTYMMGLRYKF
jgi:outer membrane receptor protein involved in Fe transport